MSIHNIRADDIRVSSEGEALDLLLDLLRSSEYHVVYVDGAGGEFNRRLKDLLTHHSGLKPQGSRYGWHLFREKNLVFFPVADPLAEYDVRNVTDFVTYRFPWQEKG